MRSHLWNTKRGQKLHQAWLAKEKAKHAIQVAKAAAKKSAQKAYFTALVEKAHAATNAKIRAHKARVAAAKASAAAARSKAFETARGTNSGAMQRYRAEKARIAAAALKRTTKLKTDSRIGSGAGTAWARHKRAVARALGVRRSTGRLTLSKLRNLYA